jgi:FkbM family methyltransferase
MFNNCDFKTNGEEWFYNEIKEKITTIFDVGCREESLFTDFHGEVHYFDPVESFINTLSSKQNSNKKSYFNTFGLGEEDKEIYYFPKYQSFYDRVVSCNESEEPNKIRLKIKKGKDYMTHRGLKTVDFLKIDTEGYELNVLKGFEYFLLNVKIVQFEYGGTFLDSNTKLIDVVNYLKSHGFERFFYLSGDGLHPVTDFTDHYNYCNIVCLR